MDVKVMLIGDRELYEVLYSTKKSLERFSRCAWSSTKKCK